jgi:hypothetical protein
MADIRINALPVENSPVAGEAVAIDGGSTRQTTIQKLVDAGAPVASQAEAEAGVNNVKRMTPLTSKQAIAALGATFAQGAKADTALQPATGLYRVPTFSGAAAATIPGAVNRVLVEDRDAFYARVASEPAHAFKFNNGGWWEIDEPTPNLTMLGLVGDGVTDNLAAIDAAIIYANITKKALLALPGTYLFTDKIDLLDDVRIIGSGARDSIIFKSVYAGANADTFYGTGISNVKIQNITIDGGLNGTHTAGWAVRLVNSDYCEISGNYVKNSPNESILIRDGSIGCKVFNNRFDPFGAGSGHIYLLTNCDRTEIRGNHFTDSVGGCIWLSGGISSTIIDGNSCDDSRYELIGVRYGCDVGVISNNRARSSGDNGISVTGSRWTVYGNDCADGDLNGINIYGSDNMVFGNSFRDNGKAGGSQFAGLAMQAAFGGLSQNNIAYGNVCERKDGLSTDQYIGVHLYGLSYTAWLTATAVTTGMFRYNGANLYEATSSGTTGATAPVHTSGTVSDGGVSWKYLGTSNSGMRTNNNRIYGNQLINHTVNVDDSSGARNYIEVDGSFTPALSGITTPGPEHIRLKLRDILARAMLSSSFST